METKELKIEIPEGYEIDKEKSTFDKIVFKKKDTKPRSWNEYCDNFKGQFYYVQDNINNIATSFTPCGLVSEYKNYIPSKELAEAFLALMQLMSLRQAWIGDWKPNWNDHTQLKAAIRCKDCSGFLVIAFKDLASRPLSFPTVKMAEEFLNCFKDLLETAKSLI